MNTLITRRAFARCCILGTAATALLSRRGRASELPRLAPSDPAAVALGYVEDATRVDAKKFPSFGPGSVCENCLQLQGRAGDAYRPCALFPGKLVSAKGWCSGWAAEM